MLEVHIRNANSNDEQDVFKLSKDLATSFTIVRESFAACFENIVKDEIHHLLIAEEKGGTAGYLLGFDHIAFYANGRTSWIEELYVLPAARKKGIGKKLMYEFETLSLKRNLKLIALATRRAHQFYIAIGYEESATYFKKTLARSS